LHVAFINNRILENVPGEKEIKIWKLCQEKTGTAYIPEELSSAIEVKKRSTETLKREKKHNENKCIFKHRNSANKN